MKATVLVATNLKRLRLKKGISQERLALDAGIDRTYVSRIERGLENCTLGIVEKLADALGHHVSEMLLEPDNDEAKPLKPGRKKK
jgi:transcriptional regulator with XRE-family HTH domain